MEQIQFTHRSDGKLIATIEQKEKLLGYIQQGYSVAEVARFYGIRVQNLIKWRRDQAKAIMNAKPEESFPVKETTVPVSEYQKLWEENQKLRKALGSMALDRDILQTAVDIASKKKWI